MTNTNQNSGRGLRSKLAGAALLIVPLALALPGHAARAQTQAPGASCTVALEALLADWHYIGFQEPGKPAQMIVQGRHGYTTTAGRYYYLRQQIRDSARDCEAGNDTVARQNIAMVRRALGREGQNIQFGD